MRSYQQWVFNDPCPPHDNKLFKFRQKDILKETMAGDNWADLWPSGYQHPIPAKNMGQGIESENFKVRIAAHGNIELTGAYYHRGQSPPRNKFVVIVFSGSGGPANHFIKGIVSGYLKPEFARFIHGVIIFDYRGFGLSKDPSKSIRQYEPTGFYLPTSRGLYTDATAITRYATQALGLSPNQLILHGYSMGSGPATHLAARDFSSDIAGLVLHGPMESLMYNAKQSLTEERGSLIGYIGGKVADLNAGFRNIDKLKTVHAPICICCGPNDKEMWPQAMHIIKKAKSLKKAGFLAVHDGSHDDTAAPFRPPRPQKKTNPPANSPIQLLRFLRFISQQQFG